MVEEMIVEYVIKKREAGFIPAVVGGGGGGKG